MKPYYSHAGITIYHGDCRSFLCGLPRFDCIVADPPYGVNGGSGTKGRSRSHKSGYASIDDSSATVIAEIVPRFCEYLSRCGRAVITPGTLVFSSYPQPDSFGCLWQPATVGMQKWGRCDSQPIFYYGIDPRAGKTILPCSFTSTSAPEYTGHPCTKPYGVWSSLVSKCSVDGEMVLDPFMGSGTTLVAAKNLGRKAIGIEIEEKYCEIAAKRLSQEVFDFSEVTA